MNTRIKLEPSSAKRSSHETEVALGLGFNEPAWTAREIELLMTGKSFPSTPFRTRGNAPRWAQSHC